MNFQTRSVYISPDAGEVLLFNKTNDFSIGIATVNGSGSQSSNNILMRSIFKMGLPVSGKNLFPSNIAGLPTWFFIRVNEKGHLGRQKQNDIFVAMNKDTVLQDVEWLKEGGVLIYNSNLRFDKDALPKKQNLIGIPFNDLVKEVSPSIQLKKLLINMIYVGILSEWLQLPEDVVLNTIKQQFRSKESVYEINKRAIQTGFDYAHSNRQAWPYLLEKREVTENQILIDGNTSGALGLIYGGCSFGAWYPITPSSSLAESFENYCQKLRVNSEGKKLYSMVQAEDELAAISMVAGAGWAGSRAMTATSGPGISLMTETIGLMYFAEVPGVIWDVQRMGPSTGLPTRTSQGDILSAAHCSHGDTRHPIFFPSSPRECFEFAFMALDLSEKVQTPVFILSDLDLGMNSWISDHFKFPEKPFDRGKVLKKEDLEKLGEFARYRDVDGDAIPYRTLPGTEHDLAAYLTRGTGHTPEARYSERADNYQALMDRLSRKWETIKTLIPPPNIHRESGVSTGLVFFGSTGQIVEELLLELKIPLNLMDLKAYPFHQAVEVFLKEHERIFVVEQNQQGQMAQLLCGDYPQWANRIISITHCDGLPPCSGVFANKIKKEEGSIATQ